jgi:hypothetical protein
VVPHDRCPHCWQVWDFKLHNNSTCQHCGLMMGDKCKLLLDTDECPSCNEGKVTVDKPVCDKCGYEVDRQMLAKAVLMNTLRQIGCQTSPQALL